MAKEGAFLWGSWDDRNFFGGCLHPVLFKRAGGWGGLGSERSYSPPGDAGSVTGGRGVAEKEGEGWERVLEGGGLLTRKESNPLERKDLNSKGR